MREKLLKILQEVRPDVDFEAEKQLIRANILESFDIVTLVSELDDAFDIEIGTRDLTADNFDSVDSMLALIQSLSE